ncbi:RNA polymerase sigma factor [Parabacteroides pacaensis]|uniref:RNA polymerase sigma factor n=1 Tax=Parabacteroides pacaensis TaxID=2086575 RepID=UPI000D0E7757|nr:RNA polymerase sigma-70 factor [Parabacteroides pacaensis]
MQIEQIDKHIIQKINEGDEKSFAKLYEAYYVYLRMVAFFYINDEDVSGEVVNDVFLQVWNKRGSLAFPITSYLVKAVQNCSIDYLRTQQSLYRALNDHKEQFILSYQENYIRSTPQPLEYVELRQAEEELKKAIDQLPSRCREIFTIYFYEGKPVEEIAEDMDIKISTVRVQLKNAFDRLRELLKHLLLFFF